MCQSLWGADEEGEVCLNVAFVGARVPARCRRPAPSGCIWLRSSFPVQQQQDRNMKPSVAVVYSISLTIITTSLESNNHFLLAVVLHLICGSGWNPRSPPLPLLSLSVYHVPISLKLSSQIISLRNLSHHTKLAKKKKTLLVSRLHSVDSFVFMLMQS